MRTAICLASGPSLTQEDVDYCRGKGKVYAVKEARLLAPWADVLYAADDDWWQNLYEKHGGPGDFKGELWTVNEMIAAKYGLKCIRYNSSLKWSNEPGLIATGGNSGFQALNMAVLDGAQRVILLGYDMQQKKLPDGNLQKHWWTGKFDRPKRDSNYPLWIEKFRAAAPLIPVPVINCTPGGALTMFERMPLREALQ